MTKIPPKLEEGKKKKYRNLKNDRNTHETYKITKISHKLKK